ncbi:hypothetical protein PV325_005295 [Microctonus aethiopoides]|nr:hypothetical protein PV325_005295 [Microctonus aethiopoides]KAK0096454.1 hypothetical protein PV326_005416 [Microctonus aethiopoides]
MVDMLMIENDKSLDSGIKKENGEANSSASPWCKLLGVNSKVSLSPSIVSCKDLDTKVNVKDCDKDKLRGFSGFQRRTLSGLSFKSDAGPLLNSRLFISM